MVLYAKRDVRRIELRDSSEGSLLRFYIDIGFYMTFLMYTKRGFGIGDKFWIT